MEIFAIEKEKNDNLHDISSYEPAVLANKIKKECMQQNTTLKTMLQELSIGSNIMSHMSHGKAPSYITIARICDYLNISIDTLLDHTVTANTAPIDTAAALQHLSAVTGYSTDYIAGLLRIPPKQQFKQ